MKVALITPWDNAWISYFKREIEARGHKFLLAKDGALSESVDAVIHGWSSGDTQPVKGARNVYFLRRYELFDGGPMRIDWNNVDALICVNSWIHAIMLDTFRQNSIKTPVHLIYNGVDTNDWTFKEREHGFKIGMACHVHPKKNLPLAVQILALLPHQYELHIAGDVQDVCTASYLTEFCGRVKRTVKLHGHIPRGKLDKWWDDKSICLSTSISEGCPNNVLEAMAKGIKPVVHTWPGADRQFGEFLFERADGAVDAIRSNKYYSESYKAYVQVVFPIKNTIAKAVDVALGITT